MPIRISDIKVGDIIVFSDVEGTPPIVGKFLVVEKSQKKNDSWLDYDLGEYIRFISAYRLTKDMKVLMPGTKLTIDETFALLSRVQVIDHLEKKLSIPTEKK